MAGSLARFAYTADDGEVYALKADRSNTEAINGTVAFAPANLVSLPSNIKPRYVLYRDQTNRVTRKCYLLQEVTDVRAIADTYSVAVGQSGSTVLVFDLRKSFYSGEKYTFNADAVDTALTDNDT